MLGVVALMVAFINAFFLKKPTGSHEDDHVGISPEVIPSRLSEDQFRSYNLSKETGVI